MSNSSCNGYQALKDFKGLKHGGVKLFKTCNGCREKKRRPGQHKVVQHPLGSGSCRILDLDSNWFAYGSRERGDVP